ncbi:MAG: hypothetical protein E4H44_03000, partial [Candidatus Aminicenantes bacterium]
MGGDEVADSRGRGRASALLPRKTRGPGAAASRGCVLGSRLLGAGRGGPGVGHSIASATVCVVWMRINWRATAPGMREVYQDLSRALAGSDFYLAGGTALALLEGHRISVDLDLFSPTLSDAETLLEDLVDNLQSEITDVALGQNALDLEISGVRVSLIRYRYPLLKPTLTPESNGLRLADRDDIATMKLSAITNRGSRKDFIDFWVLLDRHRTLPEHGYPLSSGLSESGRNWRMNDGPVGDGSYGDD